MSKPVEFNVEQVVRLWLHRQQLANVAAKPKLTRSAFRVLLQTVGALQIDSVNVVDRAHYLTLWSRFGDFKREQVDRWTYRDKVAYEYWGHEASLLPAGHLPLSRRRMKSFPPDQWRNSAWWTRYETSAVSKRRVLKRIAECGPLESSDFQANVNTDSEAPFGGWNTSLSKDDKRSLQLLWHAGKIGIAGRRHFRKVYDLAQNVYTETPVATQTEYHDSWLFAGLSGNGIATLTHLKNYMTAPPLNMTECRKVIDRNLKGKHIVEVRVKGHRGPWYAMPEHLESLNQLGEPQGTTLICPFDSLLWQRKRAEDLMGFRYRVEIYVPEKNREFGYYVLPILHNGKLVGRIDPKFDRQQKRLTIKGIWLEPKSRRNGSFDRLLRQTIDDLAKFLGATDVEMPVRY